MKDELRGLRVGTYPSEDGSAFLRVRRTDDGVIVEVVDEDADIFYEFTVNERKQAKFKWGQASTTEQE